MAHPHHHAVNSAGKFGGAPDDCLAVHQWFDATKAHLATPAHRALRHHTAGIFEAEATFGVTVTNSADRDIPTRFIGEWNERRPSLTPAGDVGWWLFQRSDGKEMA